MRDLEKIQHLFKDEASFIEARRILQTTNSEFSPLSIIEDENCVDTISDENCLLLHSLSSVKEYIIILDFSLKIQFCNDKFLELIQKTSDEVCKKSFSEVFSSENSSQDVFNLLQNCIKTRIPEKREIFHPSLFHKKNAFIEWTVSTKDNRSLVLLGDDLSERKELADKHIQSNRKTTSLLRLAKKLTTATSYSNVADAALEEIRLILGFSTIWLYLYEEEYDHFVQLSRKGKYLLNSNVTILPIGNSVYLRELSTITDIHIIEEAAHNPKIDKEKIQEQGFRTIIHLPIEIFQQHKVILGLGTFFDEGTRVLSDVDIDYLLKVAYFISSKLNKIYSDEKRTEIENELKFVQSQYKLFLSQGNFAMYDNFPKQEQTRWFGNAEQLFGYSISELNKLQPAELLSFIHPNDVEKVISTMTGIFADTSRFNYNLTYRIFNKNREILYVDENSVIERDESGRVVRNIGLITNITEKVNQVNVIRERESRYNTIIEQTGQIVYDWNITNNDLKWFGAIEAVLGFSDEVFKEFTIDDWFSKIHPEDQDRVSSALKEALEQKKKFEAQYRHITHSGEYVELFEQGVIIFNPETQCEHMLGSMRDVTAQKQLERLLLQLSNELSFYTGDQFFHELVRILADGLHADFAFIGKYSEENGTVTTVSFYSEGKHLPNITYSLDGTPCANVFARGQTCIYNEYLQEKFPTDEFLKDFGIQTYVGTTIYSTDGKLLGILVTLFKRQAVTNYFESILKVFATRASGELERYEIQKRNELLSSIVEKATDYIGVIDATGKLVYINKYGLELVGLSKDTPLDSLQVESFHTEAAVEKIYNTFVPEAIANGFWQGENVLVHFQTKEVIDVFQTIIAHKNLDGSIHSFSTIIRDVREQKKAQKEVLERERKLEETGRIARVGSWEVELQHQNFYFSKQYREIFEIPDDYVITRDNSYRYVHPEDLPVIRGLWAESMADGQRREAIIRHYTHNGKMIWGKNIINVIMDNGQPIKLQGVLQDVTQYIEIQREIEAKNAEMERFVYTVSHDLKSPLITIKGFLGALQEDVIAGETKEIEKDILRISGAAQKMQTLLEDLLELSRVGRMVNPTEIINLQDVIIDVVELLHVSLNNKNAKVLILNELPVVCVDKARMYEVFQNLIENSLKFSRENVPPRIEISSVKLGNEYQIAVKDNGIGIENQYFNKIFGLFDKLNVNSEGTGIGLALVKRIIEFHHGKIWVESQEGFGTTFYFTLPLSEL